MAQPMDRELALEAVRITEAAAIAASREVGRGDERNADRVAVEAMRTALNGLPIDGEVVIGEGERDEAPMLYIGEKVGLGGVKVDIALDPLEGTTLTAKALPNALTVIAIAEKGSLLNAPDTYMDKIAIGPGFPEGVVDLDAEPAENIAALAKAKGVTPSEITACVLDRPRHHDLIEEIRNSGARIKLIQDGDVTAAISAAIRGTNDHLAIGIGGTRQAVLTAGALRCLGGEIQAQLWPTTRSEIEAAREAGIDDAEKIFTIDDLSPGEVIVVATGVSNGDLLRGVRFLADSARTHSLVMCTRCNWVRFVDGVHFFARERREEVRLLN